MCNNIRMERDSAVVAVVAVALPDSRAPPPRKEHSP
jgi:hypothetical protein